MSIICEEELNRLRHLDGINLSVETILDKYPYECIPAKLRPPSGAKARKAQHEEINPHLYDQQARMVAFRVQRENIHEWIRALSVVYLEKLKLCPEYKILWYDNPEKWIPDSITPNAIYIEFYRADDPVNFLYKLTFFVSTGTIQVQGNQKDHFTNDIFPLLKTIVHEIRAKSTTKSKIALASPERSLEIENGALIDFSDDIDVDETFEKQTDTFPKTNNEELIDDNVNPMNNEQLASSIKLPAETCVKQVRDEPIPSIIEIPNEMHAYENTITADHLNRFQSSLGTSIQEMCRSHDERIGEIVARLSSLEGIVAGVKVESLSSKISKLTATIDKMDAAKSSASLNESKHLESELTKTKHKLAKSESERQDLFVKLEVQGSQMQSVKKLHEACKSQLHDIIEENKDESSLLVNKLKAKHEEILSLQNINKSLKEKNDELFQENLSLKMHISAIETTNSTKQNNPEKLQVEMTKNQEISHERKKQAEQRKPEVLIIGTSNTDRIEPSKLSSSFQTFKKLAYTIEETKNAILEDKHRAPDVVVLHPFTNDLKTKSPETCVEKSEDLINITKKKWPETKIVLSLTTPRKDDDLNSANASVINALAKRKFKDTENFQLCDHASLSTVKSSIILGKDNIHLTQDGVAMLSANIKRAVFKCLGMEKTRAQQNGPRNPQNGPQSPPRDRRFHNHTGPPVDRTRSPPRDSYNNGFRNAPYHSYEYRESQHQRVFPQYRPEYAATYDYNFEQDRRNQTDRHSNHWHNDRVSW